MSLPRLPAQQNHPETSWEAAMDPAVINQAQVDRDFILERLGEVPDGLNSDALSALIEVHGRICPPNQIASRLMELRKDELAMWVIMGYKEDGKPIWYTHTTRRGKQGRVHRLVSRV